MQSKRTNKQCKGILGFQSSSLLSAVLFPVVFFLMSSMTGFGADITLAWDPKTDSGLAGYKLYYGTASRSYNVNLNTGNQATHTVTGLGPGTYYFAVTAYYTGGIETGYSNEVSTTISAPPPSDSSAPLISAVQATYVTHDGAKISWNTDENSDTQVQYGPTTAYGSSTSLVSALITNHSVQLSGLQPYTLYYFRVKSRDAAGNLAVSADFNFGTLLPFPINVTVK